MKELEYPFDSNYILKKKKMLKKQLLEKSCSFIEKNIAILGGSTTSNIKIILDLFLLNYELKRIFMNQNIINFGKKQCLKIKDLINLNQI